MGSCKNSLLLIFLTYLKLASSQLPSHQAEAMARIYEIFLNDSSSSYPPSSFPWTNFTKESNPCSWAGVSCGPNDSSISGISFSSFSLSNSDFLPLLCLIDTLESVDVLDNRLNSIPRSFFASCGKLANLRVLNFGGNTLRGPLPAFDGFSALERLNLSRNTLSGEITTQLSSLASLRSLDLSFNSLDGSIPTNLGPHTEELRLSFNAFTGRIPSQIAANYRNLRGLDLSSNRLDGPIPIELGRLAALSWFAANQNGLVGTVPSGLTARIGRLDLSYNRLSGVLPPDLLAGPNLQSIDLSFNELTGSIPGNVSGSLVRLRLGSNSLTGNLRAGSFRNLDELTYLELGNNSLSGPIPPDLGTCPKLALLDLGSNRFFGQLPREIGHAKNLQRLNLQNNAFFGQIPEEITSLARLQSLNLSWNSFDGPIPSKIDGLKSLSNLDLRHNGLSGQIPGSVGRLAFLIELQLGSNRLSGQVPEMPEQLQIALNLSHNLFEGPIPIAISRLSKLEVLDLSSNRFSGEVPEFLAGMGSLTRLVLSNNRLSGKLPRFQGFTTVEYDGNDNLIGPSENNYPTYETSKKKKKKNSISKDVIALLSLALVTVTFLIVMGVIMLRKYRRITDEEEEEDSTSAQQSLRGYNILTSNVVHRSNIDLSKAVETSNDPSNVTLKTRFSTYYEAIMPSGISYFVKKLNSSNEMLLQSSRGQEKFAEELRVLGKISNSNVMVPLAYALTLADAYLIYDFAPKGSLFDVLHGQATGQVLDWANRYSIAIGLSQGLAFLHGFGSGQILLFDLSSKTVLLKSTNEPQIGDIELYRVSDPSKSTGNISTVVGSVGYIPPEYAYTMRVTAAGNVYSFGVVLLELLTGKTAVFGDLKLAEWAVGESAQGIETGRILDPNVGETSGAVRRQMLAVLKVALACVSTKAEARPKMKSVLRMILNAS